MTIKNGNSDFGGGVLIQTATTLTLINSTVSGNAASGDGGGIRNYGTLILTISTVSSNASTGNSGGGINSSSGTLTVTNSTISGNTARRYGGGILTWGGGNLTLTNSTISNNTADIGGGGILNDVGTAGTADLTNTIIAGNAAPTGPDCWGPPTSLGNNLDSDGTCNLTATGDLRNIDPMLGPLQNNGGPTLTHALLAGSPAIDTGDDTAAPHTDQRGVLRPQGLASDIGAYEFHDTLSPNCTLASLNWQWVRISVRDGGSGLANIVLVEAHNMDVSIPDFSAGNKEVTVSGKRRNSWPPQVHLQVTDLHGNVADCKLSGWQMSQ